MNRPSPVSLDSSPSSDSAEVTRGEVLEEVQRVLDREFEAPLRAQESHDLVRDLSLDSVGLLVLAVALEDRFHVKLSEDDDATVRTVGDLISLVLCRSLELRRQRDGSASP
jgi:acyl carrier protein